MNFLSGKNCYIYIKEKDQLLSPIISFSFALDLNPIMLFLVSHAEEFLHTTFIRVVNEERTYKRRRSVKIRVNQSITTYV